MKQIKYPKERTFYQFKSIDGKVLHKGYTEPNQVTTSGQPILISNTDASLVFPPLPIKGDLIKGEVYSYDKGMITVEVTQKATSIIDKELFNFVECAIKPIIDEKIITNISTK